MGRAAAVRANTKAKTDAKKAKVNALYGKKIIVAVKAGGSPNPEANMLLKETIARAKANNVPVDVSIFQYMQFHFSVFCGDHTTFISNEIYL
jgi:transcriptional/translational regulatory protein YebC/TACO1